jgi:cyclic dehypoxanthinyl futalosine synthase
LTNTPSTSLSGFQSSPAISCRIQQILDRAAAGERLPADDSILLLEEAPLAPLGLIAHQRRMQRCPEKIISFVMDRNISTSNECEAGCKFCAFHVPPGDPKAFTLSSAEIVAKVIEAAEHGATQVMLQGGLNPRLNLDFYELVFRQIKQHTPNICLHSLSPTEILYLSRRSGLTIHQCLERLCAAGLDSLPGGGAEILVEEIRQQVSPLKITATEWLEVMEIAQRMGMKTTATMVYGLGETFKQRVEHLLCIRDLQDRTGGFTAFIPWSFQPHRTRISRPLATAVEYLKLIAVARLVLDNVPHIQAGWVTEGPDVAQLALSFGADDFGGVLMEEQVVRATGVNYTVTAKQVIALIKQMGMVPAQRTTQYQILHRYS